MTEMGPDRPGRPGPRRFWIETVAIIGLAAIIDSAAGFDGPVNRLMPYVFAVGFVALRSGFFVGFTVSLVAAALFLIIGGAGGITDLISVFWILASSAAGLMIERHLHRVARLEQRLDRLARPPDGRAQVTGSDRPGQTSELPRLLYRYARLLNVVDEEQLLTGLAVVLREALPSRAAAVYRIEDDGLSHAAGDPLPAPSREHLDITGGAQVVRPTEGPDSGRAVGVVRSGVGGLPVALIAVDQPGRPGQQARALRLFEIFVEWASASVEHARAVHRLSSLGRQNSARDAEARGRAAARRFAETGRLSFDESAYEGGGPTASTLVPPSPRRRAPDTMRDEPRTDPERSSPAKDPRPRRDTIREGGGLVTFGFGSAPGSIDEDDTERIDPAAVVADVAAARRQGIERTPISQKGEGPPSLLIPAARAAQQIEEMGERPRRKRPPAVGGETVIDPAPPMTFIDPEAERVALAHAAGAGVVDQSGQAGPDVDALSPDVRRAIERMAERLLHKDEAKAREEDPFDGLDPTDMQPFDAPGIENEMVAEDELPLMGSAAFGMRIAHEVGKSGVQQRFATLLASLSDHLEPGQ